MLSLLTNDRLEIIAKKPFLKYLINAYMKMPTGPSGGAAVAIEGTTSSELAQDPKMWQLLSTLRELLELVHEHSRSVEAKQLAFMAQNAYPKRFVEHEECTACYDHPSEFEPNYFILVCCRAGPHRAGPDRTGLGRIWHSAGI